MDRGVQGLIPAHPKHTTMEFFDGYQVGTLI